MNRNERMGLVILRDELNRCKVHVQRVIEYTNVVSQIQHREDRDIALQSQEEQLECHLAETNDAFDNLGWVIENEWELNKDKIKKDMKLLRKRNSVS
jgi:hypothetical protein